MTVQEQRFDVAGLTLAARRWHEGAPHRVLALHGWLDNAVSFDRLAPCWPEVDLLAVDLPGHGFSGHRPLQGSYNLWDDLPDLLRLCDLLGWERFSLLGHSRGGMMALLLAAALPERVDSLVCLDGLIPDPVDPLDVAGQLGRHLREQLAPRRPHRGYDSLEDAVAARCRVMGMAVEDARELLRRSLELREGRWYWRSDPRLNTASAFKLTAEHNRGLLASTTQPGLVIFAEGGLGAVSGELERSLAHHGNWTVMRCEGSHHAHFEAEAPAMAASIEHFWQQCLTGNP